MVVDETTQIPEPSPNLNKPQVPEPVATRDSVEKIKPLERFQHFIQQIRKQGLWLTLVEAYEQITRLTSGAPSHRFSHVSPGLDIGGQFLERGWRKLQERGITAVVSLRGEYDDAKAGIAPPRYLHLPTVDNHAPTLEHLQQGVQFIKEEIERGGKVYIHCWEGVGRAPTMAAAYLVSTGLTPLQAWAQLCKARPFIRPMQAQLDQIDQFAAILQGKKPAPPGVELPGAPSSAPEDSQNTAA